MAQIKCTQTRCSFNIANMRELLCPNCAECNAPSNIIEDDTCVNCHNCLNDEGFIRSGLSKGLTDKLKEIMKDTEEKLLLQENKVT